VNWFPRERDERLSGGVIRSKGIHTLRWKNSSSREGGGGVMRRGREKKEFTLETDLARERRSFAWLRL
jgi:hypothetical protein